MGAKSDHFCLFSAYFGVFSPDLWMEYRIFISIVDISANLENIDINIDIDKAILKNIDIDKGILQNIDIDKAIMKNIDIQRDQKGPDFGTWSGSGPKCQKWSGISPELGTRSGFFGQGE